MAVLMRSAVITIAVYASKWRVIFFAKKVSISKQKKSFSFPAHGLVVLFILFAITANNHYVCVGYIFMIAILVPKR
jgi:hypothetical protein